VHVVEAPGARVVTGQVIAPRVSPADAPVKVSFTVNPVNVTFPVFVARNEYFTVAPAAVTVVGAADFVNVNAGVAAAVTVAVDAGDVTAAPVGGVPETVAELLIDPLSTSFCVTV
jgi:hypothetical protein